MMILNGGHVVGGAPVVGRSAFSAVAVLSGLVVFVSALGLSSEAFVKEKREDTLGLLFLTPLRPIELVLGKLLSTSLPAFYRFVAVIPIMALPILLGGVSLADFLLLVLGLLGLVLLSAAIGLLCSALSWDEKVAGALAMGFAGVFIIAGPLVLYRLGRAYHVSWSLWLLAPTPIYPIWIAATHQSVSGITILLSVAWTALALWLVIWQICRVLPYCCRSRPITLTHDPRSGSRPVVSIAISAPTGTSSNGSRRFKFSRRFDMRRRGHLLDRNPILWLSLCSQGALGSVWIVIGAVFLAAPVIAVIASVNIQFLLEPGFALFISFVSNAILKVAVATAASTALGREHPRDSLELLISTPVTPRQLVEGHASAIRQTMRQRVLRLIWVEVAWLGITIVIKAMSDGWGVLPYALGAAAVVGFLIPDLQAVGWSSLWQGVIARNAREAEQAGLQVLAVPWMALFLSSMLIFPFFGNIGTAFPSLSIWIIFSFLANRWFTRRSREHLTVDLELMARRRAAGELEYLNIWGRVGRWLGRWWASGNKQNA
ncbi:MAG: family transporter protein [Verrucomicrobiales bacterium]|nr:family transporter protein [Verrucomicrobiales bacterium]